jgi:hypothetical protein
MDDRLSIKYFFEIKHGKKNKKNKKTIKQGLVMNNDVMMQNKEHETFQFTQLNINLKDSKTLIYLLIL